MYTGWNYQSLLMNLNSTSVKLAVDYISLSWENCNAAESGLIPHFLGRFLAGECSLFITRKSGGLLAWQRLNSSSDFSLFTFLMSKILHFISPALKEK